MAGAGSALPETESAPPAASLLALTHGNVGFAAHFRDSLHALRDSTSDPGIRALLDDVAAGRKPPRALGDSAAFDRLVTPGLAKVGSSIAAMSAAERAALVEQGRAHIAALVAESATPRRT